jgi:hypothetical protein
MLLTLRPFCAVAGELNNSAKRQQRRDILIVFIQIVICTKNARNK